MTDRPEQLPEGRLIALAQKRARLSGREAARRAGMSEGHWRAIVSGSRSISKGNWVPVGAPADTLARMAEAVGATPEQLEAAGRADAAEELRELTAEGSKDGDQQSIEESIRIMREVNDRLEADPELARAVLQMLRRSAGQAGKESAKPEEAEPGHGREETA